MNVAKLPIFFLHFILFFKKKSWRQKNQSWLVK